MAEKDYDVPQDEETARKLAREQEKIDSDDLYGEAFPYEDQLDKDFVTPNTLRQREVDEETAELKGRRP